MIPDETEPVETTVEISWAVPPWLTGDQEWPQRDRDLWWEGYKFALVNYDDAPVQGDARRLRAEANFDPAEWNERLSGEATSEH